MKRLVCGAVLLLFTGWLQVRAGLRGAAFIYQGTTGDVAILQPVLPAKVAVQLEKGPRQINKAEVLTCEPGNQSHKGHDDQGEFTITEMTLTCGDRVFVVKGIQFTE